MALARGVIAVGFAGSDTAAAPLSALRELAPGALILFARNVGEPHELRQLVGALRGLGSPPPLIAVDQEGGRVARIGPPAVQAIPAAMALGATGDAALTEALGALVGRDLAALGISVDFAPVADLALEPDSLVIGTRAYGDDPARVAEFAGAFAAGLERGGVAAALKHFPGHGATAADSHSALPRITLAATQLRERDLVPFARAIAARVASIVMTAHVVVEAFDAERPATLSAAVLTGLLRGELGFAGVVATDCLEMDAIAGTVGTVRAAVAALVAGADLVLISHRLELAQQAVAAIADAVRDGTLPLARLQAAHERVLALRERFAAGAPPAAARPAAVQNDGAPLAAARRAVTVLRGAPRLRAGAAVTVISFEGRLGDSAARSGGRGAGEAASLSAALRRRGWKSELMRVPLEPDAGDIDLLLEHVPRLGEREFVLVVRRAHLYPAQRAAVARLLGQAPHALVVSARDPYDALLWPAAERVMCSYGDEPLAFEGLADVLAGRAEPGGTLPVRLSEYDAAVR